MGEKERPHFELTYVPKESKVINKLERKLSRTEELQEEVKDILAMNDITPTKIHIKKTKSGKGSKGSWLEDYSYKRFHAKIRGMKKSLFGDRHWKNDFDIYLLSGKKRDGLLFSTETSDDMRTIGTSIYYRLVKSMSNQGVIPWNRVTRTGLGV